MKTVVIVQARMGSTRLPGKVMEPIEGTPMIGLLLERVSRARVDQVMLATSEDARNDAMAAYVSGLGFVVARGSEHDVLGRFHKAAKMVDASAIVRVTGDCPLIDPTIVDLVVDAFRRTGVDYASNVHPPTYPDGLDTEVFTFGALDRAFLEATSRHDREHVTPYLNASGEFRRFNVEHQTDLSAQRWTVDRPEDLALVRKIFAHFAPRRDFGWEEVLALRGRHPEWFATNAHIARNEGVGRPDRPKSE